MSEARLRAAVAATAGLLAFGALWWLPQRPAPRPRLPADRGAPAPPVSRGDTIRRGEGMVGALTRLGLAEDDARRVVAAAGLRGTARRDLAITLRADSAPVAPSDLEFHVADDKVVRVRRVGGGWEATQRRLTWNVDTVVVRTTFDRTLVRSLRNAGTAFPLHLRADVAYAIAEAYEYRLDVSRDLGPADSIVAIVERQRTALGATRLGPLLAAAIRDDGRWIEALRHVAPDGTDEFYDGEGRPLRTSFLVAPVDVARISSGFGRRLHPVLGIWHNHTGTDYAAPHGTPVRVVGDGIVEDMGVRGSYGNLLEVRHINGVVTRYGHLSRFARGLRPGMVVQRGDVVAYVGSTGRSTAPHLHFEVIIGGVQREPARALRAVAGTPLGGTRLAEYRSRSAPIMARLGIPSLMPPAAVAAVPSPAPASVPLDSLTRLPSPAADVRTAPARRVR